MNEWISVRDSLPEHEYGEGTDVLTVDLYGVMRVLYFDGGNWCWPNGEPLATIRVAPITHWMQLPDPPEEAVTKEHVFSLIDKVMTYTKEVNTDGPLR